MAKKAPKFNKAKAARIGAEIEAQGKDAAHNIWLAGIGAYGRAYTEARDGALKFNSGTSEFFDDLVKRGAEIEGDVLSRLASNERITTATDRIIKARTDAEAQIAKVADVASRYQEQQRERLEARMEQMRSVLGLGKTDDKASRLHAKLDKLEDEVASLRGKKAKTGKAAKVDASVADRLARLTGEIEAIAEANAPAPKAKRKPAAKKKATVRKAATAKKKTVTKKPAARKTTARKTRTKK